MELIQAAIAKGQRALNEHQAKKLLRAYNISTVSEQLVQTADEAAAAAGEIGWPVALKACGPDILHKTGQGLMTLNLDEEESLRRAFARIEKVAADQTLEGMLVQAMVSGHRELVVGMKREPQFGPCVMVGLGGILTEIYQDTAFRVAPFDDLEAMDMIEELRCRKILQPFRGEAAADLDALCQTIVSMGKIAMDFPMIEEIDVNPLVMTPQGKIVAVDALVILADV
ncbi:MAG: acetate--CoA ligase family protein [Desulfobacterales bacterium]|nr:acetate--CoA ligase family protein [Desulfobacterales bacterium]